MDTKRRRGIPVRTLIAVVVAFVVAAGTILTGPVARQARAQEEIAAAIVEGDCGNPGDVAADLRALTVAEGGSLTSFTTIDLAIGDLTGGDYAVVAGDPTSPDACGEIAGDGDDVYVPVRAQSDANLGGIAWLHARTDRTQVSLFLGEDLGGNGAIPPTEEPTDQPEPPIDETPEPPGDETPVPTSTPDTDPTEPAGETEVYDSPTYGYSIAYDTQIWRVETEESGPGDGGTVDSFVITVTELGLVSEFYGVPASPGVTALDAVANIEREILTDPELFDQAVRTDAAGNEIRGGDDDHAYVAINFSFESESGRQFHNVYHLETWVIPDAGGALIMIYQAPQDEYDLADRVEIRETLIGGIVIPE